jgi:tryptophan synthase alpha chain
MNRFEALFSDPSHKAFVPFFTLGDPNPQASLKIIKAVIDAGADALELGIPFSDPVADGPTNQRSMERALKAGVTFDDCLKILTELRAYAPKLPIGLLLYYNLIHRRGMDKAHQDLAKAGVDAIVSADLPIEESLAHEASLKKHGIGAIQMVAPNTPNARAQELFARSSAFTYVLSGFGATGARQTVDPKTIERVKQLRQLTDKPMVVGFGISEPEHVHAMWQAGANGAIVGSKFTSMIEANLNNLSEAEQQIVEFTKKVKV